MTQENHEKKTDAGIVYADIINLPHFHVLEKDYMSNYSRAAQFSSFNALSGYEDMVQEEAREVSGFTELTETELSILNQRLSLIYDVIEDGIYPIVTIRYFVKDQHKNGGTYVDITAKVRRIDLVSRQIELLNKVGLSMAYMRIDMDKIQSISGELVDYIN
ncbi:MAG: hypothetical protein MJ071_08300 [Oscillospiraceae bacterium]|nr:hypothetical protein [Oscillospiraceae bacterium]